MTYALLAIAFVSLCTAAALSLAPGAIRATRRWLRPAPVVSLLFFGYCLVVGGGKLRAAFDAGIINAGSWVTNDTLHIAWSNDGLPSATTLYIDYREAYSTNEWRNLAETTVSALYWHGTLANAESNEYWVYTDYTPPTPVHTNGVWTADIARETKRRKGANAFLIMNAVLRERGKAIAPPAAKRKEGDE